MAFILNFFSSEVPRKGFVSEHESKIHICFGLQFLEISLLVTETRNVPPIHSRASCLFGLLFLNSRILGHPWSWLLSLRVPALQLNLPPEVDTLLLLALQTGLEYHSNPWSLLANQIKLTALS